MANYYFAAPKGFEIGQNRKIFADDKLDILLSNLCWASDRRTGQIGQHQSNIFYARSMANSKY